MKTPLHSTPLNSIGFKQLCIFLLVLVVSYPLISQVTFDDYYRERSIFFQNENDSEDPDTYPKKFARVQYFHEDRACDDQK